MKRKFLDFSVMKDEISQNNVLEMAELIAKNANKLISDSHVKVTFKEQGQERKEGLRLSNKKIKATGWAISTSIEDGIYKTMKEYLKK